MYLGIHTCAHAHTHVHAYALMCTHTFLCIATVKDKEVINLRESSKDDWEELKRGNKKGEMM